MKIIFAVLLAVLCMTGSLGGAAAQPYTEGSLVLVAPPPMRYDEETLRQWFDDYEQAEQATVSPEIAQSLSIMESARIATSMDLLSYLPYVPEERNQGYCGNCWAWAGTGVMEVANTVQRGTGERLSVQFIDSCYAEKFACCGGNLTRLSNFYTGKGYAVPWSNPNALYQDKYTQCSAGGSAEQCSDIGTTPNYPIISITPATIYTQGAGQATAISNIKNVLNQKKAISFSFIAANETDWKTFDDFWWNNGQSVLWNVDGLCNGSGTSSEAGGHAVLLVGYNDDDADPTKHYWIVLNSWGTASGKRPQGLFRMPMRMNYDCKLTIDGGKVYNLQFQTLLMEYEVPSLKVAKSGNGSGTVTSSPAGISCGTTCTGSFAEGTVVTLTALADSASAFTGWSGGGCSGTGTCVVTIGDGSTSVTATFARLAALAVYKGGSGAGHVTSTPPGIDCRFDQTGGCTGYFAQGTSVTLTAEAETGSAFAGWSGPCTGKGTCTVTVSGNTNVTATFTPPCAYTPTTLAKAVTFRGGLISITVKANQKECGPPDVVKDAEWIQIATGTWKNGQGVVKLLIPATTSSLLRSGKASIGGNDFTVTQSGVVCAITKTVPTSASFTAAGGSTSFDVYLNATDCAWTTATPVSWITVDTPAGSGTGPVSYTVEANLSGKARTSKVDVLLTPTKKKSFTVKQAK
jgi:C1A family cysteine protease